MLNLQHPDLVSFFVSTGGTLRLGIEKTEQRFCYKDPRDHRFYLLNGHEDLENFLISEFTPEYTRSGSKYTMFFEQKDWLHMPHYKIELLGSLASMPDVTIEVQIYDDEPSDEYLIRYMSKGRQSSIDK